MKEAQLINMKKRIEGLTNVVRNLVKEVQINADIVQGTLAALQHHLGKDEWEKIIEELKDIEKRHLEKEEKPIGPQLEIPEEEEELPPSQRK